LYTPVCDGHNHVFSLVVRASRGVFQAGAAQAFTFATVEADGMSFTGVDENTGLRIVSA